MTSPQEDAVHDFNLDFLHPTTQNIPVHAIKKTINKLKHRIIKVDTLQKYAQALKLELSNKNQELESTKKKLASTTKEYTQTRLDYKEALENHSKCEKECLSLQHQFKDFQNKYYEAVNNVDAERSHVVQLQQLVKQHERKIEQLQKNVINKTDKAIKESLERELLICRKTYKKDLTDYQNKYNKLLKELQETKYSKEKLQEQLLAKNDKLNNEIAHDFISHDEHRENDDDMADDCSPGFVNQDSSQNKLDVSQRCPMTKEDVMHVVMDNDFKNDVVSVDTGCGSSLASSLNSPDFVFSPINGESFEINRGRKLVNTGTSPILLVKMTDTATSPILLLKMTDTATSPPPAVKMVNVGTCPIKNKITIRKSFGTQTESVKTYITSARHICADKDITDKTVSNTVQTLETLPKTDTLKDINNQEPRVIENIPQIGIKETQEKQCLELNNSNNMKEDCIDNEVVMILNTMRFNHKLITPIPKTPKTVRSVPEDVRHTRCQDAAILGEHVAKLDENVKKTVIFMASAQKVIKHLVKNDSSMLLDSLKNLINVDWPDIELDNPVLNEKQTMPACSLDSQIEVNLERISTIEPLENSNVTQDENRVLLNTLEMEIDHNISSEVDKVTSLDNSVEVQSESPTKVPKKKGGKNSTLTPLGKYRKICQSRPCKIKRESPPLRKPRIKPKPIIRQTLKRIVKESDTFMTLNNKDVLANAVHRFKAMAEKNASKKSTEPVMKVRSEQLINTEKDHIDDLQCDQFTLSDIKSPKSTTISVNPVTVATKLAASFPKSKAILQSPKVSPSAVTSSTTDTDIRIPRRSSRSSVLAASCSPVSPVKSSTSANPSNVLSNLSPISPISSPALDFKSPIKCITSTLTTNSTPRATRRSLRLLSNSSNKSLESGTPTVPTTTTKPMTKSSVASVTTRSQVKCGRGITDQCVVELNKYPNIDKASIEAKKRKLSDNSDTQCKRVLRSTLRLKSEDQTTPSIEARKRKISDSFVPECKRVLRSTQGLNYQHPTLKADINQPITSLEIFAQEEETSWSPKESILCVMIKKYAKKTIRPFTRNVSDAVLSISDKIETYMLKVKDSPSPVQDQAIHELVQELHKYNYKDVVSGLLKYLTNPDRKMELFGKTSSPPQPQMTRYESFMLYVIIQLSSYWRSVNLVELILTNIEYTLFKLNRTPHFDVVESVSHFYALICRYFRQHSRLKVFMLDSMYCILFKSIPLIKQCLEVHPHIIPLAHMSTAKTSLVTILVYLLHFYKCNDQLNRVQEIRNILSKRYHYQMTEWNETKLLEFVGNSIMELEDSTNEQKILRKAVILLGKRHGPKWTEYNIVKKLFQIIEKVKTIPEHVTAFCVALIGPLMKPYPADLKVYCEIALNKLVNIMNTTTSQRIEEAAIISLIRMARHNSRRVNEILFSKEIKAMSPELEDVLRDYITERPLHMWNKILPKISMPT